MRPFRARNAVAIFAVLLGSIHARAADMVTFNLGWLPQGSQAGIFLADAQGYYTAENLDVKIVRGYGLLRTVNEIDQGVFEFGVGDATAVLLNRSDGGKTRLIGILGQNPAGLCWIEGRHQITQPSELKGKTLGLAAGSAGRAMVPVWLKRNGVNPDALKLLQVEPGVINAALMQGTIDLAECWKGADLAVMEGLARKDGLKIGRIDLGKFNMDTYGRGFVTSEKMLATNPGLVQRFLKASYRGYADMLKDPAAAADVTVKRYPTLNREDTLQQAREQAELFVGASLSAGQRPGVIDRTKMERTREFLAEVYQKADVRVDDLYTNDFLPMQ